MKSPLILLALGAILALSSCANDVNREIFLGTYSVEETCNGGNDSYDIIISESLTDDKAVNIYNLYNSDGNLEATVNGDKLKIRNQQVFGTTYKGSGTLDGDNLLIEFKLTLLVQIDDCTANCTRQ